MLTVRQSLMLLFGLFSTAMLGLAAGAVWMLPTLFLQRPLPWLALPVGALLAWAIRGWVRPGGWQAALLAVAASVLAEIYVSILTAAVRVAGSLGMGMVDAMHRAGLGMLLQLAHMAVSIAELGWFVAGALLAAWVAYRRVPAG